jgi:hypothetical protein
MKTSNHDFKRFYDERWAELPQETRDKARRIIVGYYNEQAMRQVRDMHAKDPVGWASAIHFGGGMVVRNLLRTGRIVNYTDKSVAHDAGERIPDDELPSGNWDDYYVPAMEYAAGIRVE